MVRIDDYVAKMLEDGKFDQAIDIMYRDMNPIGLVETDNLYEQGRPRRSLVQSKKIQGYSGQAYSEKKQY